MEFSQTPTAMRLTSAELLTDVAGTQRGSAVATNLPAVENLQIDELAVHDDPELAAGEAHMILRTMDDGEYWRTLDGGLLIQGRFTRGPKSSVSNHLRCIRAILAVEIIKMGLSTL